MPSVPVGGLDVNVTQVLQPVSATAECKATQNRSFQPLWQIIRIFLAELSPIRHLRTGGNFERNIFYANGGTPATAGERAAAPDCRVRGFSFAGNAPASLLGGQPEGGRYGREGMPRGIFLFGREDFGVGGFGGGGGGDYVEGCVDIFGYWGEADFGAAGLVSQFHGNALGAERGGGKNG